MSQIAYIIDAVRTPRGRGRLGKGALGQIHPQELLAQTLQQLIQRTGANPGDVDDVIVGCVAQVNEQGANISKNSVMSAGWPDHVTAVTLNRFCGSGLQAIQFAAMGVMSGAQDLVVAGGVENMSKHGLGCDGGGIDGNNLKLREKIFQVPQGISADLIATLDKYSRTDVDQYALRSHQRAAQAQAEGRFNKSLFSVVDPATGKVVLEKDECVRPETTLEGLAGLKASFVEMGAHAAGPNGETLDQIALKKYPQAGTIQHIHTAGNSSAISDGAGVAMLASESYAKSHGLKPRGRIRAVATMGAEPVIMLTGPAPACRKALKKAGMNVGNIDLWEINEAFAVVPLQVMRELGLDAAKVNVNGGAIAMGHPLGASGAILFGTALDELERRNLSTAMITLCIGGGQAVATVIERI